MIFSPWVMVGIAGMLEIVWAVALKYSDGFTRPLPTLVTIVGAIASFWFLSKGMQALPAGTAYAVWVGIGALGVAILGIVWFGEGTGAMRLAGIGLIVAGIVTLKLA